MTLATAIGVVVTIYLVVTIIFALIFVAAYKYGEKSDENESFRFLFEAVAESKGTTIYGAAVMVALYWPLALAKVGKGK